eukprot:jgi/Bigna1/128220/aug1.6_g2928
MRRFHLIVVDSVALEGSTVQMLYKIHKEGGEGLAGDDIDQGELGNGSEDHHGGRAQACLQLRATMSEGNGEEEEEEGEEEEGEEKDSDDYE